jgi:hypothetical protein
MSVASALVCASSISAQPHQHGDDGVIGVNGAGMLSIEMDLDEVFEFEELFASGSLNGYISDAPGFTALDVDEPDEDFYTLGGDADIQWMLVGTSDSAMQVYNPFFDVPSMSGGESFALGMGDFDTHPFWFLNTDEPSFDPSQDEWSVDFMLVDAGATGYGDSDTFTIRFAIPAPSTAIMLAGGCIASSRRRRY